MPAPTLLSSLLAVAPSEAASSVLAALAAEGSIYRAAARLGVSGRTLARLLARPPLAAAYRAWRAQVAA